MNELNYFTLLIERRPLSVNAQNFRGFKRHVEALARARWENQQQFAGLLYARVTWFHRKERDLDVDNIPKRILDSLKGVVFEDDIMFGLVIASAVDLNRDYEINSSNADDDTYSRLLNLVGDSNKLDFVYVEVGPLAGQRVAFGPLARSES